MKDFKNFKSINEEFELDSDMKNMLKLGKVHTEKLKKANSYLDKVLDIMGEITKTEEDLSSLINKIEGDDLKKLHGSDEFKKIKKEMEEVTNAFSDKLDKLG